VSASSITLAAGKTVEDLVAFIASACPTVAVGQTREKGSIIAFVFLGREKMKPISPIKHDPSTNLHHQHRRRPHALDQNCSARRCFQHRQEVVGKRLEPGKIYIVNEHAFVVTEKNSNGEYELHARGYLEKIAPADQMIFPYDTTALYTLDKTNQILVKYNMYTLRRVVTHCPITDQSEFYESEFRPDGYVVIKSGEMVMLVTDAYGYRARMSECKFTRESFTDGQVTLDHRGRIVKGASAFTTVRIEEMAMIAILVDDEEETVEYLNDDNTKVADNPPQKTRQTLTGSCGETGA
jgi:hypothetical protein